jgi:hypothetical protein
MSEKRFKSTLDEDTMSVMLYLVSDKEEKCFYNLEGCVDLLNEQHLHLVKSSAELCKKQIENDKLMLKINELQQKIDILCEDNDYGR